MTGPWPPRKIAAIAEIPLGREMAHAINAFKTAGGFRRAGFDVTLLCLAPLRTDIASALAMYGEEGLRVVCISPPGTPETDAFARDFAQRAVQAAAAEGCDFLYARNFHAGLLGPREGLTTVIETHAHVGDPRPLLDEVFAATSDPSATLDAIVTIAPALRDHYIARGADPSRVHIVPDAADPEMFRAPAAPAPDPMSIPSPRALYSGHLYDYKGIPTILRAAREAPDIQWILLGGARSDVQAVQARARDLPNVHILGRVPHARVGPFLWNADVLLLPPEPDHPSAQWTSPVKLAEYLWADRPIVASSIQGLRNWVGEPAVSWFEPGNAGDMVRAVRSAFSQSAAHATLRQDAQRALARAFTYENRAGLILQAARASTPVSATATQG